ncbi:5-oxoprolinase subunit B family protein [Herbiconiux daphne]|uniref:Allophanate hydrolase subunit 1 n=1 Tax=Herbiconiux daphne TaxID=2970914 RepID=A0ABT2GZA7_9MICO|nr:allophanate hydrolase subunit 1 [Herbiconiux daphne]MCS5733298.1 allophanate hydrolase subunit 1 [Herbiconiux daphne]
MAAPVILPVGGSAVLIELPVLASADTTKAGSTHVGASSANVPLGASAAAKPIDLYRALRATAPSWVTELVPAATTVLVVFDRASVGLTPLLAWIDRALSAPAAPSAVAASAAAALGSLVEIATRYDGADLATVAELAGLTVDGVIAAHSEQTWTADFIGFAPGFAYLSGENDLLAAPRRSTPRPVVPAGSVALAAGYCGIYPRESPGGWHLIGTTTASLWDARRTEPALLAPGTRVRFVPDE